MVERKTPGNEMEKSPGQISLSRLAPSTRADVPLVRVELLHLDQMVRA